MRIWVIALVLACSSKPSSQRHGFVTTTGTVTQIYADGTTIIGNGTQANPLVALGASQTAIYYNVKNYGAKGDGATDDTNAIRSAISAANTAGGGTVYFPNGTYMLSEHNTSFISLQLLSGVSLLGQGRSGTILEFLSGQRDSVVMIRSAPNAVNISIQNLTIDGNKAAQIDPNEEHRDCILLDNTSRVRIVDVECRQTTGSGIAVWQNSTDVEIDHVYVHDVNWCPIVIGDACGQKNIVVRGSRLQNNIGGFHIEVSCAADNIRFEDSYVDASQSASAVNILGGAGVANWVTNVVVKNVQVVGYVQISSASNVWIQSTNIVNSDAATGAPPNEYAALRVTGAGTNIFVDGNSITETAAGTANSAVILAGTQSGDTLSNVNFTNNDVFVQGTAQDGVLVQSLINARVIGNRVFGNATATGFGINVNNKLARVMNWARVRNNYVSDFPIGVVAQGGGTTAVYHIDDLEVVGNNFESVNQTMASAMSLDYDTRHVVQAAEVHDNVTSGVTNLFGTYPNVPMLVGGSRNGVSDWVGSGAPTLSATQGSTYRNRTGGTGTSLYKNESGSTTWVAL